MRLPIKVFKEKSWQHEITGHDGNTMLFGVNIFKYNWKNTGKRIRVTDPQYGEHYTFPVYSVLINEKRQEFAAGEFSNCIWGFYLLKY